MVAVCLAVHEPDAELLAGQLASLDAQAWHDVLAWAAAVSAVTVSRRGADPPYRHEMG